MLIVLTNQRSYLKIVVEPGQGFDENVRSFVGEFIATSGEQVDRLVQIEVIVTEGKKKNSSPWAFIKTQSKKIQRV